MNYVLRPLNNCYFQTNTLRNQLYLLHANFKKVRNSKVSDVLLLPKKKWFPKGRCIPLVEGGVKAPPENASVQGGRRSPCREFTF